ncbi:prevent-host-death protein [Chryseobacterium sp. KACC 21268]|nr:prevent-host-death protein [Chryseobacterium sp. KACC 21268]
MNYKLELQTQDPGSNIVFNNIILDVFKVNIVERYSGKMNMKPKLCEVVFKVRTLDDQIIKKKDGNVNTYIRNDGFTNYKTFINVLSSYHYKKKLINRKEAEQDFVHFILSLVVTNYELN